MAGAVQKAEARKEQSAPKLFKAMAHELRAEILTLMVERATPVSPNEIANALDEAVTNVSHHMKQLVKYRCAELVDERPRRGAMEHFYRATTRPYLDLAEWKRMQRPGRDAFSGHIGQKVVDDLVDGFDAGTVDSRSDRVMARTPMTLDGQGWAEMLKVCERALEESFEVQARSDERRSRGDDDGAIRATSVMLFFEMPDR